MKTLTFLSIFLLLIIGANVSAQESMRPKSTATH